MAPFGETVLAWRLARGLTQDELARRARIARPNLSAIERGARDVTLSTLRALALALDVGPGQLVEGIGPGAAKAPLGREALERIAHAVAVGATLADAGERALGRDLDAILGARMSAQRDERLPRSAGRRATRAWLALRLGHGAQTLGSLAERVGQKSARKDRRRAGARKNEAGSEVQPSEGPSRAKVSRRK